MFAEDVSTYFDTTTGFAQTATLAGQSVAGIFDNPATLGALGQVGLASSQPVLTLPTSSVPADPVGVTVVVGAVNYLVAVHEPDGTGVSRLLLELA